MRRAKSRAARKASGRLGSNLPVSKALMVCRVTSRASANWAFVQSRSARSGVTGSYLTRGRLALAGEGYHFAFGLPRFLRIESPRISMRWALCTSRSRIPSASVGSPICSCQRETGSCEVRMVELT